MNAKQTIKFIITLAAAHLVFPSAKIDMITVALVAMSIVPWLEPLFKSIGLPGGIQFEFQDLKKIETDAKKAGLITTNSNNESFTLLPKYDFIEIAEQNKDLALLSLRIEVEKKLRGIAAGNKIDTQSLSADQLINRLEQKNILNDSETNVLKNMLSVLNKASQTAMNDERVTNWVINNGPSIISNLEKKIPV
jgi:hypothetical protein